MKEYYKTPQDLWMYNNEVWYERIPPLDTDWVYIGKPHDNMKKEDFIILHSMVSINEEELMLELL